MFFGALVWVIIFSPLISSTFDMLGAIASSARATPASASAATAATTRTVFTWVRFILSLLPVERDVRTAQPTLTGAVLV